MSEAATLADIRLALGRVPDLRLFRNNTGSLKDHTGRVVSFGLFKGSSDLIGFRSIAVTPEMVGQRLAVFVALEVKAPGGRHPVTDDQRRFLDAVAAAGGIAGVARDPDEARIALGLAQAVPA
ncbi:MAG: VRR-NUC domain-containing protein [Roseomonas sp.]|nr:VRR-NUC domain-containing protein [Roseomonas sp.]